MNLCEYKCLVSNSLGTGYIAGTGDGIATVAGIKSQIQILLYAVTLSNELIFARQTWSLINGQYLFKQLDTNQRYLLIARDVPPDGVTQRYEPAVWDYVTPATDLTPMQQQELWQSWQTPT